MGLQSVWVGLCGGSLALWQGLESFAKTASDISQACNSVSAITCQPCNPIVVDRGFVLQDVVLSGIVGVGLGALSVILFCICRGQRVATAVVARNTAPAGDLISVDLTEDERLPTRGKRTKRHPLAHLSVDGSSLR